MRERERIKNLHMGSMNSKTPYIIGENNSLLHNLLAGTNYGYI